MALPELGVILFYFLLQSEDSYFIVLGFYLIHVGCLRDDFSQ